MLLNYLHFGECGDQVRLFSVQFTHRSVYIGKCGIEKILPSKIIKNTMFNLMSIFPRTN